MRQKLNGDTTIEARNSFSAGFYRGMEQQQVRLAQK